MPEETGRSVVEKSEKDWFVVLLLSISLGFLGVDRFYLGKIGTGALKLVTLGGFGFWWLIDSILIAIGNAKDSKGKIIRRR